MHIALILDGNRRWAKKRGYPVFFGHKKGIDNLEKILKICAKDEEIKYISAFALSTENMKRDKKELKNLFDLIERFAKKTKKFIEYQITVKPIGDFSVFPISTKNALKNLQKETIGGKNLYFAPALHFGGRDEIVRAVNKLLKSGVKKITEDIFSKTLDTAKMPPVDLLIRTGGKNRLSNFLLWECAYAEIYFSEKMWPEFEKNDLYEAIEFFKKTQRNFGK